MPITNIVPCLCPATFRGPTLHLRFAREGWRGLIVTLLAIACFAGCHRGIDPRLLGEWSFDRDYTQAHLPPELSARPESSPAKDSSANHPAADQSVGGEVNGIMNNMVKPMLDLLKPTLAQQLIGKLDGSSFTITPKLITYSSGEAETYQMVEHASANTWSLKKSDGKIETYTLEDGRLAFPTTGDLHFKIYYKRVEQ